MFGRKKKDNGPSVDLNKLARLSKYSADNNEFDFYMPEAIAGSAEAQYVIGQCYLSGRNCIRDFQQAIKWLTLSAEQGYVQAQFDLGCLYGDGEYIAINEELSFKWQNEAAKNGHPAAWAYLATFYFSRGPMRNPLRGLECLERAKELGCDVEPFERELATNALIASARRGDADAQFKLAKIYACDEAISDIPKSFEYLMQSARAGHRDAIAHITSMANENNELAQFLLGDLAYENGKITEAIYWYSKAANQSDAIAQFNLGVIYYWGKGVPKNYKESMMWFSKAANNGNTDAMCMMGCLYHQDNNDIQAIRWFSAAAEKNHADASTMLAEIYLYNSQMRDISKGKMYLERAISLGSYEAKKMAQELGL